MLSEKKMVTKAHIVCDSIYVNLNVDTESRLVTSQGWCGSGDSWGAVAKGYRIYFWVDNPKIDGVDGCCICDRLLGTPGTHAWPFLGISSLVC